MAESKRPKVQINDSSSGADRLSNLPDLLLCRILSLLPTKRAVATSILSKRWMYLWTSITNLEFSDHHMRFFNRRTTLKEKMEKKVNFINYVNRVLLLLNPPSIHKFNLGLDNFSDTLHINNWICAAVGRNVRELELNLPVFLNHPTELPRSLFGCKTLEVLNLSEGITFNIPKEGSVCFPNLKVLNLDSANCSNIPADGSICFPILKILHLIRVKYVKNGDCLGKLMRNCPVLEDLVIIKTSGDYLSNIELRAHALRSLELNFSIEGSLGKVQIDSPALQYLNILNWHPSQKILLNEPISLIEAKVDVRHRGNVVFGEGKNVYELLKASNKVKCLSVLGDTARVIKNGLVPSSWNLTRLEMVVSCCDLHVLQQFLQKSYKLEQLVFTKGFKPCGVNETWWTEHVPKRSYQLKWVQIQNLHGCTDEVAMIKHILKYSKILKKMTIQNHYLVSGEAYVLLQKIAMFPRGSTACEVEVL